MNQNGERSIELGTADYRDDSVTTAKGRPPFYNARAESMSKSVSFSQRRCLLPCDGFYEWLKLEQPGRKTLERVPFLFRREDR